MTRQPTSMMGTKSVLIVEDSPTQADQLRYILEKANHRVTVVPDGLAALESIATERPEVVISDIVMPHMSGYELCSKIRENEALKDLPVVLVTVLSDPTEVIRALEANADGFVRKPYVEHEILSNVWHATENRRLQAESASPETITFLFNQRTHVIHYNPLPVLNILLSTYDAAVNQNAELVQVRDALRDLNLNLEDRIQERTAMLQLEIERRKQAERKVEEERNLLRTILDNLPDLVYLKDNRLRYLLSNRAHQRFLGVENESQILGKSDSDLSASGFSVESSERERKAIDAMVPDNEFEEDLVDSGGKKRRFEVSRIPIISDSTASGLLAIFRDVTETRRLRSRLLDVASLPSEDPNPVTRVSHGGRILYANEPAIELLSDPQFMEDGVLVGELRRSVEACAADRKNRELEQHRGERVFQFVIVPVAHRSYVNIYGFDVTQRRTLETRLIQASKMEAVGRVAGGVAHDFNNMLLVVHGYAEHLQNKLKGDKPLGSIVSKIMEASERASSISQQLLNFVHQRDPELEAVDLNAVIDRLGDILSRVLPTGIELVVDRGPGLWLTLADASQMDQVLLNLVINGRDAIGEEGTITLKTRNVVLDSSYVGQHFSISPGEYVLLSVSDTGMGMDEQTQARIFDPFFTTKGVGVGTGLGLAVVYGVVDRAAGDIRVSSKQGEGTVFEIYLPRTTAGRTTR